MDIVMQLEQSNKIKRKGEKGSKKMRRVIQKATKLKIEHKN